MTSSSPIDGEEVDGPDELGTVVRSFEPGDVVDVDVQRGGETVTVPVVLGANTDQQSPTFGAALLGVGSRTPLGWQEMSLGEAAVSSVTELFPVTWESTKGIVQVFNPVNIFEHLSGESDDLSTRPTTVVGITQVSGEFGERARVLRDLAVAGQRQRVRRRVQHVPAACRSTVDTLRSRRMSGCASATVGATSPTSPS